MRKRKTNKLIEDKREKSDQRFTVSISKSELVELESKCDVLKCSKSEFIRMLLENQVRNNQVSYFSSDVQQKLLDNLSSLMTDLDAEHRALIASSNNLNQITKQLNSHSPFTAHDTQLFVKAVKQLSSSMKSFRGIFNHFNERVFDLWNQIVRR